MGNSIGSIVVRRESSAFDFSYLIYLPSRGVCIRAGLPVWSLVSDVCFDRRLEREKEHVLGSEEMIIS